MLIITIILRCLAFIIGAYLTIYFVKMGNKYIKILSSDVDINIKRSKIIFLSIAAFINIGLFYRYIGDSLYLINIYIAPLPLLCNNVVQKIFLTLSIIDIVSPLVLVIFLIYYVSYLINGTDEEDTDTYIETTSTSMYSELTAQLD